MGRLGRGLSADRRRSPRGTGLARNVLEHPQRHRVALLSDLGPQPLAQVMGTSVYQVGWQYLQPDAQWGSSDFHSRLDGVNQAWDNARRLAFGRLLAEAQSVGADAVVGVRLRRGEHDWARR